MLDTRCNLAFMNVAVSMIAIPHIITAHTHSAQSKCGVVFNHQEWAEQSIAQGQCGPSVLSEGNSMKVQCISEMSAVITLFDNQECQASGEDRSLIVTGQQDWVQGWQVSAECSAKCLSGINTDNDDKGFQTCGMVDTRSEGDGELWTFQRDGLCLDNSQGSSSQVFCRCDGNALVRHFEGQSCEGTPSSITFYNTSELASDAEFDVWCDPSEDCGSVDFSQLSAVDGALIRQEPGLYKVLEPHQCLDHSVMVDCHSSFHASVSLFDAQSKEDCAGEPHTRDFTSHGETVTIGTTALQIHCFDDCVTLEWESPPPGWTSEEPMSTQDWQEEFGSSTDDALLESSSMESTWEPDWGQSSSSTDGSYDPFKFSSSEWSSTDSSENSKWGWQSSEQEADWSLQDIVDKHTKGAATVTAPSFTAAVAGLTLTLALMFVF